MVLRESVSVSNVSKRPIVRCLQRLKNTTLGLDFSSYLLFYPSSPSPYSLSLISAGLPIHLVQAVPDLHFVVHHHLTRLKSNDVPAPSPPPNWPFDRPRPLTIITCHSLVFGT
jgi:hypothetical protein